MERPCRPRRQGPATLDGAPMPPPAPGASYEQRGRAQGRHPLVGRTRERVIPPPVGCSPVALRPPTLLVAPMLAIGAGGRAGSMVHTPGATVQRTLVEAGPQTRAR